MLDRESRKISDDRKNSGFLPLSSSSYLHTNNGLRRRRRRKRRKWKFSDFLADPAKEELRQCLVAAGIGKRSKKLDEILDLDLDPDFVKGHIAAREAALANQKRYPVSWLITKLLDGDPVPVVKLAACPDCGSTQLWSAKEQICLRCEGIVKT